MKAIVILLSCLCLFIQARKLILVQVTFRHGARNPIFPFSTDYSDFIVAQNISGQLTTRGKYMQYLLGKTLYNNYWSELFGGTPFEKQYNQSKFFVKSTDVNRTIQSAQSQLMGWFENLPPLTLQPIDYQYALPPWQNLDQKAPNQTWQIFSSGGSSFHPTPIHVQKLGANSLSKGDFLVNYDEANCPNQNLWLKQNYLSQKAMKVKKLPRVVEALSELSKVVNQNVTVQDAYKWIDNYICLKYQGLPYLPIFEDPKYSETFKFIKQWSLYFSLYQTKVQKSTSSTGFFQATKANFEQVIPNVTKAKQLILYSAHDTTLAAIMSSLQLASSDCIYEHYINQKPNEDTCISRYPPFASTMIFQFYDQGQSSYTFRTLYNGKQRILPFCGTAYCPFEKFTEWLNNFQVKDMAKQCGMKFNEQSPHWSIIVILFVIIVVLILFILYRKYKSKQSSQKQTGYQNQNDQIQIQDEK